MLSFELLARFRKELSFTGSALYETIVAIAERVNRKVQVLRLHGQALTALNHIQVIHRDIGRRVVESAAKPMRDADREPYSKRLPLEDAIRTAADRIKGQRVALQHIESHIRDLKLEVAQDELVTMQRDLGLRDAALERVTVGRGAPIIGHPIGDFDMPGTTRIVAVLRGPFLLSLSDSTTLRQDDVVILAGLRRDLTHWLPHFQSAVASKTA